MELTDREIALLMVAANSTSHDLREAACLPFVNVEQLTQEADDLDSLWTRLNEERTFRQEG